MILGAKKILVTEGPYDKKYLEKAISIFAARDPKYKKLKQVAIIPAGGAGNAQSMYEGVLSKQLDELDKIVFLFDAGFKDWRKINQIKEPKLETLFYQTDYSIKLNTSTSPQLRDTIMLEDLFCPDSYKQKVDWAQLAIKKTHKDFRSFKENMASIIKSYIEGNYNSFKNEWFDGFKPVLDQLITIFQL